jgi:hypothetical protein
MKAVSKQIAIVVWCVIGYTMVYSDFCLPRSSKYHQEKDNPAGIPGYEAATACLSCATMLRTSLGRKPSRFRLGDDDLSGLGTCPVLEILNITKAYCSILKKVSGEEISREEIYPLVNCYTTMENHHFSWEKSTISMDIFNSYVKLPEGTNP